MSNTQLQIPKSNITRKCEQILVCIYVCILVVVPKSMCSTIVPITPDQITVQTITHCDSSVITRHTRAANRLFCCRNSFYMNISFGSTRMLECCCVPIQRRAGNIVFGPLFEVPNSSGWQPAFDTVEANGRECVLRLRCHVIGIRRKFVCHH